SRKLVIDVVDIVCTEILSHGGFRAKSSQRIATVDQMWADRLLDQFNGTFSANPRTLVSPVMYVVSATRARRAITTLTLLALGAAGTLLSILDWLNVVFRVAGGVLAVVVLGVLASLIFVWLRGE